MLEEIFNIGGKKILAMGGAESHDTQHGIIDPADYHTRRDMIKACRKLEKAADGNLLYIESKESLGGLRRSLPYQNEQML